MNTILSGEGKKEIRGIALGSSKIWTPAFKNKGGPFCNNSPTFMYDNECVVKTVYYSMKIEIKNLTTTTTNLGFKLWDLL
jgi:hypothetical protein